MRNMHRHLAMTMLAVVAVAAAGAMAAETPPVANPTLWLSGSTGILNGDGNDAIDGEGVRTWVDQSTGGWDVGANWAGRRPMYTTGVTPTGAAGIYFDTFTNGGDNKEDTIGRSGVSITMNSLFIVFTPAAPLTPAMSPKQNLLSGRQDWNEAVILGGFSGGFTDEVITVQSRDSTRIGNNKTYAAYEDADASISGTHYLSLIFNDGGGGFNGYIEIYLDGTLVTNHIASQVDDNGFVLVDENLILGSSNWGNSFYNGYIHEIIAYDTVLDTTDRAAVETYLNDKFVVPEPATITLLSLGGLMAIRRRRRC